MLRKNRETVPWRWGWLLGLLVCVAWAASAVAASKTELLVSGAISLKESLQEIGARFEEHHPDVKVVFNFGASGVLQQQIEQGAPVDVFVSAASKQMDDLEGKGLIFLETRHTLAVNVVVLVTPTDLRTPIVSFKDLTKPEVKRIAIGNPRTVPAGEYAQRVLMSLGLWEVLQPTLILSENVRQALTYVTRGEVDAALVYATDAQSAGTAAHVVAVAPEGSYPPVLYPIAVVKASSQSAPARAFVSLALSDMGLQILKAHGFLPPPHAPTR